MIYISIDLETTGVKPWLNQILEFGAVIEDTDNPKPLEELTTFHTFIDNEDTELVWNEVAKEMNKEIYRKITVKEAGYEYTKPSELGPKFFNFLVENGFKVEEGKVVINVAGKNFGTFDNNFLTACDFFTDYIRIHQRVLDPAMLCIDWKSDKRLPNLNTCMERKGIKGEVSHNAVEDALDVIKVLRTDYA